MTLGFFKIYWFHVVYFLIILFLGGLLIWWSRRRIGVVEEERRKRIRKIRRFESAKTTTPVDSPTAEAKEKGIQSVGHRFTIIRRITVLSITTIALIALIFPFLNQVPATFISVMVGASSVIIGIAARPFIENLISGIVISFSHPLRIGDTVIIDGYYGTVEDITITHTLLKVWNWRRYIIPNSRMLAKELINCTITDPYQWAHVEFTVAYGSDLNLVRELAVKAASGSRHFADYEPPRFWIMDMQEQGVKCWIAAWTNSPVDAWELQNDVRTALITQFGEYGILPHRFELGGVGVNDVQINSEAVDRR